VYLINVSDSDMFWVQLLRSHLVIWFQWPVVYKQKQALLLSFPVFFVCGLKWVAQCMCMVGIATHFLGVFTVYV